MPTIAIRYRDTEQGCINTFNKLSKILNLTIQPNNISATDYHRINIHIVKSVQVSAADSEFLHKFDLIAQYYNTEHDKICDALKKVSN